MPEKNNLFEQNDINNGIQTKNVFQNLKEEDHDPYLNHTVTVLIMKDFDFIVYLDESYFVQWITSDDFDSKRGWAVNYSDVLNKVALLETKSESLLSKYQVPLFRRLLGEAVATLIDAKDTERANSFLVEAENYMIQRSSERAKKWIIISSGIGLSLSFIFGIILWKYPNLFVSDAKSTYLDVIKLSLYGSLGSFLSIVWRIKDLQFDPSSGILIHSLDSFLRIAIGVIGAFLIIVIIKSGLITSTFIPNDSWMTLLALSVVSGTSERMVPNIIRKFEDASFDLNKVGDKNNLQ